MRRALPIAPHRDVIHPFDLRYGTDTGGYLGPEELAGGGKSDPANNGYSAVAPSVFHEACRRWRETLSASASRLEAFTFVDVGAGKGRALLLAAEWPFRRVIGVELNIDLAAVAQRNVAAWKRKARNSAKVRVIARDVMDFPWPRAPLLVYLNNPFDCELIGQLMARITSEHSRGIVDVLYVNPGCADVLASSGRFDLLWDAQIEMNEADQRADPYGAAGDRVAAFRLRRD